MVTIIFEPHATTLDNETRLASGWNDVQLSKLGIQQARDMGKRYALTDLDAIFTSDLERAYETARLAFPELEPRKLHVDWRLRECDYGNLTQHSKEEIDNEKPQRIHTPFPNGESYEQTTKRMKSFLEDLLHFHDDEIILIIGHRATQYGLEHLVKNVPLHTTIAAPWKWQPGWTYVLTEKV